MEDTNYKTGTHTHYSLLLSLPGIDPNELNDIPSEISLVFLRT